MIRVNKLSVFICANYAPEFNSIVVKEGFGEVVVRPYPCMCANKSNKEETKRLLQHRFDDGDDGVILCSKHCDIINLIPEGSSFKVVGSNYCFNHLANTSMIDYILAKGGYIIGLGWLNNWREYIGAMGFDQETARRFYQESFKELVFFDTGTDSDAPTKLEDLARFLELPYVVIPCEIDSLELLVKSIVSEWRLHKYSKENTRAVSEAQSQCAEYAAILDILGKVAACNSKREVVDRIKGIFISVMGAAEFKFYNKDSDINVPVSVTSLMTNVDMKYLLSVEENTFYVVIAQKNKVHGVMEASGFIFPQYIDRYLNFAVAIAQICALTITNIERYEELVSYKEDLEYKSYHDSLTGLYNRAYFNEIITNRNAYQKIGILSFDIDGLKNVNDNFGHLEGDKLIIAAGHILQRCFRVADIVARIGGDEFIAIVPECDEQTAAMLKLRIDDAVGQYNKAVEEKYLKVSISIGYAVEKNDHEDIEELIRKADLAMYQNKAGKLQQEISRQS